ncbi:hypothetical protein OH460_00610 [Vibrio sp. Makdt]|uniref:hypothetical protein n=1 Tax=Vibrio sp. Makdt TaxID=2998828 RepID=UPI0022CD8463|nr:hypothetical protein [Vibrio sp. Makdt]MDA0150802.1 hypothetical protein [Vibrio sp. Makdt]
MISELSQDELMVLERVIAKPELQPHFFSKVKSLKWFKAFSEKGLLAPSLNPSPVNTEGNYWNTPSWPITQYLVSSSQHLCDQDNEDYAKLYLQLIVDVTTYASEHSFSNYRTWWQFAKILRNIPSDLISISEVEIISYWFSDRFDSRLVSKEIGDWVVDLLEVPNAHNNELTLKIFYFLFDISSTESKISSEKSEPRLNMDGYTANSIAEKSAKKAGELLGLEVVELFESKFKQAIDIEGNDQWSVIWRRAVEEHEQNSSRNDVEAITLKLFRDALLGYCNVSHDEAVNIKLCSMLDNRYQIIQRVAIYIAGESFIKLSRELRGKLLNEGFFSDHYRHELWHFLKGNFINLTADEKKQVHDVISKLVYTDESGGIESKPTAYRQSIWYYSIKEQDEEAKVLYEICTEITGKEPDHPDFSSYMSVGTVQHESPIEINELLVLLKTPEELVKSLNDYKSKGHFREPGIEGLVKKFGELVTLECDTILSHSEHLIQLKPYYLHELFSVYSSLWEAKKTLDWDSRWNEILAFSKKLLVTDHFWNDDGSNNEGAFIGNVNWVIGTLSRLIESGCKSDSHAFGIDKSSRAKCVLELILERQLGEEFNLDSDAVSIAINSPRGRCLEAYVNLALYECRNSNKETTQHSEVWGAYEPIFARELDKPDSVNEYEFAAIVGTYLPNFIYLSEEWTLTNLDKIFDQSNLQRWLCAIQGYSYVSHLRPEIYALFRKHNYFELLLDSKYLKDETKNRYIEFVCVACIHELEKVDEQDGAIALLIRRANHSELETMVWFFWTQRDSQEIKIREIVFSLFPSLVALINPNTNKGKQFTSRLSLWSEFIDEIDKQSKNWLISIAPYAGYDYNADTLVENLARLSDKHPQDTYEIWKEALSRPCSIYSDESVKKLFVNLINMGADGERYAKDIADEYLRLGDSRQVSLYQEVVNEIEGE